ncbi:hypothetical protein [Hyphomicrobium sp.]|jgi:hypothetical protein|uniref:hypothetical protein n=1 Tax=Hyphomicrobium sp. TaxID=82 RepID=UPI00356A59E3
MLPDDVFRDRLEHTLQDVEAAVAKMVDFAAVDVSVSQRYWRVVVLPFFAAACPFDLMIRADQKYSLKLANETFEDRPVERFELFPRLVRAIEAGQVEKISKLDAMTDALVAIEMRVSLEPGWNWHGERRLAAATPSEEWRTHRYLPYRR